MLYHSQQVTEEGLEPQVATASFNLHAIGVTNTDCFFGSGLCPTSEYLDLVSSYSGEEDTTREKEGSREVRAKRWPQSALAHFNIFLLTHGCVPWQG